MSSSNGTTATIVTVIILICLFIILLYALIVFSRSWKKTIQNRLITAVKRRRITNDTFRKEYGYSWDYVIVFKVYDDKEAVNDNQCEFSFKNVLERISAGGLEIRLFYSLKHQEVFCKIRCPLVRLQKQADLINYSLLFDEEKLKEECKLGREGLWDPLKIPEECEETHMRPYQFIYGRYEFDTDTQRTSADLIHLYQKYPTQITTLSEEITALKLNNSSDATIKSPRGSIYSLTNNPLAENQFKTNSIASNGSDKNQIELSNLSKEEKIQLLTPAIQPTSPDTEDNNDKITMSKEEEATMFRSVDRLKIIHSIIISTSSGCCGLDIRKLLKYDCILAYIPLHDVVEVLALESEWLTFCDPPWKQPVTKIRNYFGEKIGLYFLFLGLYTSWLSLAAVLGFGFWLNVATNGDNPNTQSVPYFMGIMSIWSVFFLEHWKRSEKNFAMKWGMVGFEDSETVRPQFYGDPIKSAVTGKRELYFPDEKREKIVFRSQLAIYFMIFIVLAITAGIFALRIAINTSKATLGGEELSTIIVSFIFAVEIQFLNKYFAEIALKLNHKENHRTDTVFEDSLILKTFTLQFVNSYACLFYIAFLKPFIPDLDPCANSGCLGELQVTLGTILLSQITIGNIVEVALPLFSKYWNERKHSKQVKRIQKFEGVTDLKQLPTHSEEGFSISDIIDTNSDQLLSLDLKTDISDVERIFHMPEYDVMLGTFDDYAELVIQFGYSTMFVAAFPLATVLSFANNHVEIRVDGWKLCQLYRRVQPRSGEDIGSWMSILQFLAICATLVNSGLVAFTSLNMINYTWNDRIWTFILMTSGLLVIREIIAFLVPDVPEYVHIQIKRQEYIGGKILDNIEDEDEDAQISHTNFGIPDYIVDSTDFDPM